MNHKNILKVYTIKDNALFGEEEDPYLKVMYMLMEHAPKGDLLEFFQN